MRKIVTNLLIVIAASVAMLAHAQTPTTTADLTFLCTSIPAQREDGTALLATEIAHYRLYEVSHTGVRLGQVAAWSSCSGRLAAVAGTKRYAMTAVDTQGLESQLSNIVLVTTSRPRAPTGFQVRVEFKVAP